MKPRKKMNFFVNKNRICKHCGQIVMFDDCLVDLRHYAYCVCRDCLRKLYTDCVCCGKYYLNPSRMLKPLKDDKGEEIGRVCTGCIDQGLYAYCKDCKALVVGKDCGFYKHLNKHICKKCIERDYKICSFCDKLHRRHDMIGDYDGRMRCKPCGTKFALCSSCNYFHEVGETQEAEGRIYCTSCFNDHFMLCGYCGEYYRRGTLIENEDTGEFYCLDCGIDNNLPLNLRNRRLIQNYGYKPQPKFRKEVGDDTLHFGMELEVEMGSNGINKEEMAKKLLRVMKSFGYFKPDGSLNNGFEIVTHPFTWRWFKKNRKIFEGMSKLLIENGYRSYEPATCGIHIHLSKVSFLHKMHLFKFLKFFYDNHEFLKIISQRDSRSTSGSCQWGRRAENNDQKILVKKAKDKYWGGRYTAVNLENEHTAEIRIFRGTLKVESIFKNIEFSKGVFEFSNSVGVKDIGVKRFKEYVGKRRKSYGNLWSFMEEKGLV